MELPKLYDFKISERKWQKYWEENKVYKFDSKLKNPIYSIDTPPPYISGKMHIGHAFGYSQQDFIARFKRMNKNNVFYPFGTDDNGLPTERFVEKTNKVKSTDMPRTEFIELCLKTLKETTQEFIQDWKDIGVSSDFERYYSTIDKPTQKISQSSFIELYKKGEIYQNDFPTLWCTECQTSIAQAELEDKEQVSLFSTLRFSVNGKDLLIATTRPELLPACVAVFVNPKDQRYKNLIGKKAKVPIFGFEVPIIADESAQIEKGTGVLMICSYGDKYDAQAIIKHKLEPKIVLDPNGVLNCEKYKGMKIKEARKKILAELKEKDLIKEQKQINHIVNVHDKCGTEIEIIPTKQWFTKILDKKKQLIQQGKKIKWYPEFMFKRYKNWINGLDWDWNISRNRHFGVPIPVWQCPKCKEIILPGEKELPVDPTSLNKKCPKCKVDAEGESMVLDTWATSSLTPQIVSSLSDKKVNIPLSLRPQGHDIIRTWAFYTIVKSYLHQKEIPWKDIIISGNVSLKGEKMSKSKGNIIEPRTVLDNYGADALRFWAAGSKLGEDLDYQEKELVTGQKMVTKLWNASKFVIMNLDDFDGKKPKQLEPIDKWILLKLDELIKECTEGFEEYSYIKPKQKIENFFWKIFCDNYLEIIKDRLYNPDRRGVESRESAQYTLYTALLTIIKLIAPIMPYITEEIYHLYFNKFEKKKSIHILDWPEQLKIKDKTLEKSGEEFIEIISKVRKFKNDNNKSLKEPVKLSLDNKNLKIFLDDLKAVTNSTSISFEEEFKVEF